MERLENPEEIFIWSSVVAACCGHGSAVAYGVTAADHAVRELRKRQAPKTLGPLSVTMVRRYVKSKGWEPVQVKDAGFWLYEHPDAPLRQLMIPKDRLDVGFADAMSDVVNRLSNIEGRPIEEILADLKGPIKPNMTLPSTSDSTNLNETLIWAFENGNKVRVTFTNGEMSSGLVKPINGEAGYWRFPESTETFWAQKTIFSLDFNTAETVDLVYDSE